MSLPDQTIETSGPVPAQPLCGPCMPQPQPLPDSALAILQQALDAECAQRVAAARRSRARRC